MLDSNLTTDSIFTNQFFFIFYGIFSRAIIRLHISTLCALKPWSWGKNVACLISTFIYGEYVNSKLQKMLWIFFYNWLFSQMTFSAKKSLIFWGNWLLNDWPRYESIVKKNIGNIFCDLVSQLFDTIHFYMIRPYIPGILIKIIWTIVFWKRVENCNSTCND